MRIPKHIACIMDGNRRWARQNKLKLIMGHNKGVDRLEELVEYAESVGVTHMTFWAFSTENWNRSKEEVDDLMTVFRNMLNGEMIERMMKNGVKVQTIGDISAFPDDIYKRLLEIVNISKKNTRITTTFALNYGGRDEILRAVRMVISEKRNDISEKEFEKYLYTHDMPNPDLIIRTGGEQRVSGYLPWQSVYSELYFTDCLWPEFDTQQLQKALEDFGHRERRFGK